MVIVAVIGQAAFAAVQQGLPAVGPQLGQRFSLTLPELGVLFTALNAGVALTILPWGMLCDWVGERLSLTLGLAGASVGLALAASASNVTALYIALTAAGMFGASTFSASGRAILGWFAPTQLGFALGIRQTALPIGGAIAAAVLPALVSAGGIDLAIAFLAINCLGGAVASLFWMRQPPGRKSKTESASGPAAASTLDQRIWRLACGSGLLVFTQTALTAFLTVYLLHERGWPPSAAGFALACTYLLSAMGRILMGVVSDRVGKRIALLRINGIACSLFGGATALALGSPSHLLLPLLFIGVVVSMTWNGMSYTAAAEMAGFGRAGTALGIQNGILALAGIASPVVFATAVDAMSWGAGFALLATVSAAGVVILRPLDERHGRTQ